MVSCDCVSVAGFQGLVVVVDVVFVVDLLCVWFVWMMVELLAADLGVWRCIWLGLGCCAAGLHCVLVGFRFCCRGFAVQGFGIVCVVDFAVCVYFVGLLSVSRVDLVGLATLVVGCSF